jgi:hypothetical protein
VPTDAYQKFAGRVWDRLERRTRSTVFYLDATHIAAWCPSCRDGTIRIGFVDHPKPAFTVSSNALGAGLCSLGCTEEMILEALA